MFIRDGLKKGDAWRLTGLDLGPVFALEAEVFKFDATILQKETDRLSESFYCEISELVLRGHIAEIAKGL